MVAVKLFGETWVDGRDGQAALAQVLLALLAEMGLQQGGVAGVGAEQGVGDVADDGDETDGKVESDVGHHAGAQSGGEAALDLCAGLDDHEGHEGVEEVADDGDDANEAAPAEADAAEVAEAHVQAVGATLDLGEDAAIVVRQARGESLPTLLGLARGPAVEPGSGDGFKVGVLQRRERLANRGSSCGGTS